MRGLLLGLAILFLSTHLSAATISSAIVKGLGSQSVYLLNERIVTSSYTEKTFYDIAGYNSVSVMIGAVSAGSITTCNVIWGIPSRGSVQTLRTETIHADGTPYTGFKSDVMTVRIYSNHSSPVTVTGNILLRQNEVKAPVKQKGVLTLSVGNTSTTFTVTPTTQGYWFLQAPAKVYIDTAGGTATSGDLVIPAGGTFSGVYFHSGDVVKMISETGTVAVTGFVYE